MANIMFYVPFSRRCYRLWWIEIISTLGCLVLLVKTKLTWSKIRPLNNKEISVAQNLAKVDCPIYYGQNAQLSAEIYQRLQV